MANLIATTSVIGGIPPIVNLDSVIQVSKVGSAFTGSDGNPSASQSRFGILFSMTSHGQNPQTEEWRYATEEARDDDFDAILADNNSFGNLFQTDLTAGGPSPIININNVLSASIFTSTFTGSNGNPSASQARFVILITFKGHGKNPQALELRYDNESDRDDDYALILSNQVSPDGAQTLRQVLNLGHDLVDGNNFQGTDAGLTQEGTNVNGFGEQAAKNNSGDYVNALGFGAGDNNSGSHSNFLGNASGSGNTGSNVNAFGGGSAINNTGRKLNALGENAARDNTGDDVNAFGTDAAYGNTLNGQTIFSNASLPSYANAAAAAAAITVLLGASAGCTYLYFDDSTDTIKAIRLA